MYSLNYSLCVIFNFILPFICENISACIPVRGRRGMAGNVFRSFLGFRLERIMFQYDINRLKLKQPFWEMLQYENVENARASDQGGSQGRENHQS